MGIPAGKKTTALLLAVLGLLIFFSKTVYFYNLPEVSAAQPFRGVLNKLETAWGLASWAVEETLYAERSGVIGAVFVREGEEVRAGQILLTMNFDVDDAERNLQEIRNNIKKLTNDIDFTAARLETLTQALNGNGEAGSSAATLELDRAERELWAAELSYSLGDKSGYDLEAARDAALALRLGYERECETLRFDLAAKTIDRENQMIREESCLALLQDYRTLSSICAGTPGIVVSLSAAKGMYIMENSPLISIGTGNEFTVDCVVSLENNFILPSDHCELSNTAHVLDGTVLTVKPGPQGKLVSIRVVSGEVSAGESFEVSFEKTAAALYTLVPNAAVNQDGNGYFLNRIKRRRGIMGEEYYVERLDVYIGDSDLNNTVITGGLTFFEPVVLRSDKPVAAGDTVSLVNPEDFFEN
ncbi:MAG: HlyD family secretion protein [Treponema sp.]|jgi:biotin carboxyl carrier protein|nr:HlyD family secretion protein [Treponema sp.]